MLLIFCQKIPNVYIAKVCKDKKKANNSPYKLFMEFLSLVTHPVDMVHPPGSYILNFMRFGRSAQSQHKIDIGCPTNGSLEHEQFCFS